jgi:UDP-glucose 4-epimerase
MLTGAVAVTGAAGFVGRALCGRLRGAGREVRPIVRSEGVGGAIALGALETASPAAIEEALAGAAAVVHLAARVHRPGGADDDAAFRGPNVEATARVARAAVAAGAQRFVFASTVKVNGESTAPGRPFHPTDIPAPRDAYGRSKRDAEAMVRDACRGTGTVPVILRLPLVIGPGARGNVARLVDAVRARRTLPFAAIDNRRSVIGLSNLCDAIVAALDAEPPPTGVHFVADAAPVSTPALVRSIARALRVPVPLAYLPVPLLKLAGALTGRGEAIARLTGSLEVDASTFAAAARWRPVHGLDGEIDRLVAAHRR